MSIKDYGYTHIQYTYKSDIVDILIKSKQGEENIAKPIFLFCQGSLPQPLLIIREQGAYDVFPFNTDSLVNQYHLVIVSKPYVPLIGYAKDLLPNMSFVDSTGLFPKKYSDRNLLTYYVDRNIEIIKYLQKQTWVSDEQLVVAGHSEGSTVAAKMASIFPSISHLIYAGGNPMGRIMSIVQRERARETYTDSTRYGENVVDYWQQVVDDKTSMDATQRDPYQTTYEFSYPPFEYLKDLKIPVLVCYGTKDMTAPFNDFLRIDCIRNEKNNFQFNAYVGTEHNFFPLTTEGKPNYDIDNWDKVANDWITWLDKNKKTENNRH